MPLFVHAHGVKTHGGGSKMEKFCPHSYWMPPKHVRIGGEFLGYIWKIKVLVTTYINYFSRTSWELNEGVNRNKLKKDFAL